MINVSLVGNPNTGKTTLFNCLTRSNEHVGNWHGVTVEEKAKSYFYKGEEINIVDLPGIYSLTSLSYEEEVAVKYILTHKNQLVVNICDASNLQRNLYLTLGLLEMGANIILAVNQIDKKPICKIDYAKLSQMLNISVVAINPSKNEGISKLNDLILNFKPKNVNFKPNYLKLLNLDKIALPKDSLKKSQLSENFLKIKLLEQDSNLFQFLGLNLDTTCANVELVARARYQFIDEVIAACQSKKEKVYGKSRFDKILLNRFLAFPIFICIIALAFYLTFFSIGAWLSDALNMLLNKFIGAPLVNFVQSHFPNSFVVSLVQDALVGGVSSILGFLPQVALLFLFLSILEDSGYLSRVAFVFDDILSKVGLSGKSVYTLLMGFGCSTTAVLTARNMEDKNSKIKTGLLTPYMSCSAKFPIYTVLGGAFFGAKNIFVIMGLYFLGVAVAVLISYIFEKTILKSKEQTFILEFPPYHSMSAKRIFKVLFENVKLFLTRVGTLILSMNVIVWLLGNFTLTFKFVGNGGGVSMLESFGKIFAPIFIPLGFGSWGLVSALIAGLIAKEVIISSIAMFNKVDESHLPLSIKNPSSAVYFSNPCAVISYLVFCLLYFPCLSSIGVLSKEIGTKWTIIGCVIEFLVAYVISLIIYNFCLACQVFGIAKVLIVFAVALIIIISIICLIKRLKRRKICNKCEKCSKKCK